MKSALPQDDDFNLLDVGAGTGQAGRFLTRDFPKATYFFSEPIESLNAQLVKIYGKEKNLFNNDNYENIRFLTCLDVIEHIEDDQHFINSLLQKMPKGSRLILTVPAMTALWSKWDELMGHHRRYTKKSLKVLFKSQDVTINRLHYLFPEMFFAGLIRKNLAKGAKKEDSEFPKLSPWVNGAFYFLGNTSRLLGAINPIGSSLLIDITKN